MFTCAKRGLVAERILVRHCPRNRRFVPESEFVRRLDHVLDPRRGHQGLGDPLSETTMEKPTP